MVTLREVDWLKSVFYGYNGVLNVPKHILIKTNAKQTQN